MKQTKLVMALSAAAFGGALMAAAPVAFAGDKADLAVVGNIIPSACVPKFADGGVANFDTIKTVDLKQNDYTNIGKRKVRLIVNCESKKSVSFSVTDNQNASSLGAAVLPALNQGGDSNAGLVYGLGSTDVNGEQVSLGSYVLKAHMPVVDGNQRMMTTASTKDATNQTWWTPSSNMENLLSHGAMSYGAFESVFHAASAAAGKNFVFDMDVIAAINKGELLALNSDVPLEGNATFTIRYW